MGSAIRNQKSSWDFPIQGGQYGSVRLGKLRQMAVCNLSWGLHPRGKMRRIVAIRNKSEVRRGGPFQTKQQSASLEYGEAVSRSLRKDPYEA